MLHHRKMSQRALPEPFLGNQPAQREVSKNGKKPLQITASGMSLLETPRSHPVCNVAILGFGTVGTSVARILSESGSDPLHLTHVCNRQVARKKVDWLPAEVQWTEEFSHVLSSDADVIIELIGGRNPAEDWIRRALVAGKSVVTANKQVIAHCGPELLSLARQRNCHLLFGAAVAGGVPVISAIQDGLAGDELFKISGILNGTCNYILSKIEAFGVPFSVALAEAQKQGYAEADPSEDIDGLDAGAKLAILARVGLHANVTAASISCRSISSVESVDFEYGKQLGCTIRQVSWAELKGKRLFAAVQPALVGFSSPLARAQGSHNLVVSTGRLGGETMFGGQGAGGNPTAVAVISDLLVIARSKSAGYHGFGQVSEISPSVTADFVTPHYLRFTVKDRPGIIATLAAILEKSGINIDSVLQRPGYSKSNLPFAITLEACKASAVEKALQQICRLNFLVQPCVNLPILN
jgi:homoserine dehydrogenase